MRKILKSLFDSISNWYQENRQATHDLIYLLALSVLTYLFIVRNDLMAKFYAFTRQHEALELDDLVLTLGVISSLYVSIFAVRRWREAARHLKEANTDGMTGLCNRRKGLEILEQEIARADRYQRPLCVIMFDLDDFKTINDTYGHLAGDYVLKAVSKVGRETIRGIDTLIRWAGDEFIVLLPDTEIEAALQVAERLREAITGAPIKVFYEELKITASVGVARKDENTPDLETILARVDQALYMAKYLGRNRVASSK